MVWYFWRKGLISRDLAIFLLFTPVHARLREPTPVVETFWRRGSRGTPRQRRNLGQQIRATVDGPPPGGSVA